MHLQEFGILAWHISFFWQMKKKTVSNNLATNLAFLGSWQILPFRRAYMLTETTWHHGLWWRCDSRRTREAVGLLLAWLSNCFPCLLSFLLASGVDGYNWSVHYFNRSVPVS